MFVLVNPALLHLCAVRSRHDPLGVHESSSAKRLARSLPEQTRLPRVLVLVSPGPAHDADAAVDATAFCGKASKKLITPEFAREI